MQNSTLRSDKSVKIKVHLKKLNDKELQNVTGGLFVGNADTTQNESKSGTSTSTVKCLPYKKKDCEKESDCARNSETGKCE